MSGNEDGYSKAVAITPHASTNFTDGACHAIYVGGAGNITAIVDGAVALFTAVPVGTVLRIRATRVNAVGTTATAMVALY